MRTQIGGVRVVDGVTQSADSAAKPAGNSQYQSLIERLNLPREVTVEQAAEILTVNAKTVIRYIEQGAIEARNIAPPQSKRARYRLLLDNVLALRDQHTFHDHREIEKRERAAARPNSRRASRLVTTLFH